MTCGLQDKNVTYAYRIHIQDGEMHAAMLLIKISRFISKTKQDTV
jgi:hypothetical protein